MERKNLRFKREILGVSTLLALGSLAVIYPFLDAIILAVATSYFLRAGHKKINAYLKNDLLSSMIIISFIIGVVILGLFFFLNNFNDISQAATSLATDYQNQIEATINDLQISDSAKKDLKANINSFISGERIQNYLRGILTSIPGIIIQLGIYLVTAIYLFRDGEKLKKQIYGLINGLPQNEEKIARSILTSIDSIFRGVFITQLTVAGILAVLTGVSFYAISLITSQIPFILVWSLLIGIAAIMPLFAAFMIYGPIGIYYLTVGNPIKGLLILSFGALVLNILPEIFLRPYVGSKQMNEHPLIIFLGFIAGPITLGLKGFIVGPILLILTKEFILNYSELVSNG
ncbi:MAG: AI-2E family transporter [Candidatus Nanohaloarchaea archaeon]